MISQVMYRRRDAEWDSAPWRLVGMRGMDQVGDLVGGLSGLTSGL